MDDAGPRHLRQRRVPVQQGVDQSAVGIAGPGVHNQSHGLVYHQQMCVLVDDHQIQRLRLPASAVHGRRRLQLDALAAGDPIAGPPLAPIHGGEAATDPFGQPGSRELRKHAGQRLVEARAGKFLGYDSGARFLQVHVANLLLWKL